MSGRRDCPWIDSRYRVLFPSQFLLPRRRIADILRAEQPDVIEVCDKYFLCYLAAVVRKGWIEEFDPPGRCSSGRPRRPAAEGLSTDSSSGDASAGHVKYGSMIDRIVVENFKSLRRVDLTLGRMNLFVGANASGKSNFLDLLRVLQGIGNGFTIGEILDGKPRSATSEVWDGIRGGSRLACFVGSSDDGRTDEVTIELHGRFTGGPGWTWVGMEERDAKGEPALGWELLISFSPTTGCVTRERFRVDAVIYDTEQVEGFSQKDPKLPVWCPVEGADGWSVKLQRMRPSLGQLARGEWDYGFGRMEDFANLKRSETASAHCRDHARGVARLLANIQTMAPELPMLRAYSTVAEVQRMSERGENFAALVQAICKDRNAKEAYLSWLRQLRPEEVDDVGVRPGAMGEPLFVMEENGRDFPAAVLSDGTLRFAALAAAFFQPDIPDLMTIEEVENGIHASRARLLLELLRSQAEAAKTQVVATTHSATLLDWLGEEDYRTTFVCKRDEETGESRICALTDVPHFIDVVKKKPISELLSEGWLEAAL